MGKEIKMGDRSWSGVVPHFAAAVGVVPGRGSETAKG